MKDLFKNYHKHRVLSNISIIWMSFLLALSINFVLVWNPSTQSLKASVIDATQRESISDLSATVSGNTLEIMWNTDMNSVSELSLSLAYNGESLEIKSFSTETSATITEIENEAWYRTILLSFESPLNISAGWKLMSTSLSKLSEETSYINMIQTNFTDSEGQIFLLSSSGVIH